MGIGTPAKLVKAANSFGSTSSTFTWFSRSQFKASSMKSCLSVFKYFVFGILLPERLASACKASGSIASVSTLLFLSQFKEESTAFFFSLRSILGMSKPARFAMRLNDSGSTSSTLGLFSRNQFRASSSAAARCVAVKSSFGISKPATFRKAPRVSSSRSSTSSGSLFLSQSIALSKSFPPLTAPKSGIPDSCERAAIDASSKPSTAAGSPPLRSQSKASFMDLARFCSSVIGPPESIDNPERTDASSVPAPVGSPP